MLPGRNDPCLCGSGKKYKKCCGAPAASAPAPAPGSAAARAAAVKSLDDTLVKDLLQFGKRHGAHDWLRDAIDSYAGGSTGSVDEHELQLALPWALYHFAASPDEPTMAERLRAERGDRLAPPMRELLDAQLVAWLSLWEVQEVVPGMGMALKDLLTAEERFVHEKLATQSAVARSVMLGRVVTCDGVSFLAGLHPRALSPSEADAVVREMRSVCRVRTRPVAPAKLRDLETQLVLLDAWCDAVYSRDNRPLPTMQNTDGDPLQLTADHFEFAATDRDELIRRLSRVPGAEDPEVDDGDTTITITKPGNARMKSWENTILGTVIVRKTRFEVQTNSTARADSLRSFVEAQVVPLARYRLREEMPTAELGRSAQAARALPASPSLAERARAEDVPPEARAAVRAMREAHMTGWLDDSIPALGGLTPRQAAAAPASRKQLELLLRDFEHMEARLPEEERIDVARLRNELGVP